MKDIHKALAVFTILMSYQIDAQYVTKKDTLSGNVLNITMDSRIDGLLNKQEEACARTPISNEDNNRSNSSKITVPSRALTNNEICKQNPKIRGYKIQVAVVKSNEEARQIGAEFRKSYPSLKVEVDASLRPNYKVLAGSYFSRQSASEDLRRVKQVYKSALAVEYRVFCVEAK